jgi:hypothetical protein
VLQKAVSTNPGFRPAAVFLQKLERIPALRG